MLLTFRFAPKWRDPVH